MRWLRNLFSGGQPPAAAQADPDDCLREGYDRESRGDIAGAELLYRQAAERDPGNPEASYFLGRIALSDKRIDEAIALFQTAVELRPGEATFLFGLGNSLRAARRLEESLAAFSACLARRPDSIPVRVNRDVVLIELNRREEARIDLERLREHLPESTEIHFNLAGIYREYAWIEESIAAYRRIRELKPDDPPTYSNLVMMLHYSTRYDARAIFEEHRRFGEAFARRAIAPRTAHAWPRRLRIGYVSPDFCSHVVMYFFEPILARHDRGRFEVFCYHTDPEKDVVTERLRASAEHWVDCEHLSEDQIAERIRADRIDILVDLAGHTAGNSLTVFAMKPAPLQATYLGYPNTTGLTTMDYRITDARADPPGDADRLHTERLLRLPGSFCCYRPDADTPEVNPLPAATAGTITFGCFNNFHKMSGEFLETVAQVLGAVPGSRFLLKGRPLSIGHIADAVRERFARHGIARERLELRGWTKGFKDHLVIYGEVDISLDSYPYNGTTTTCESLWMGVPVVSLSGDRHAWRVGASLLGAMGLDDLVARDTAQYVEICARLAADPARLAELRGTLRERMRRSPLMQEESFTRSLERGFIEMWERHLAASGGATPAAGQAESELMAQIHATRHAGDLAQAETLCLQVLDRDPGHSQAVALLWELGLDAGRPGLAIDALQKAIDRHESAPFHYMLGCSLQAQGRTADAVDAFRRAVALEATMAKAHNNLGCLYEAVGVLEEALFCYRNAIAADATLAPAVYNLGNVRKQTGDRAGAADAIARALALEPWHADWQCNLGELLFGEGRLDEALAGLRAAVAADPRFQPAHANLGIALAATGAVEEAKAALARAVELDPEDAVAGSWSLWLASRVRDVDTPALREASLAWERRHVREVLQVTAHPRLARPQPQRLRIGYLAPDPDWCPVAPFLAPLLEHHDEAGFEVTCYANSAPVLQALEELPGAPRRCRDLSAKNDNDAAHRIRADGIDILIDLAGHAPGGRPLVVAQRPAAIQASWLATLACDGIERVLQPGLCYQPVPGAPVTGELPSRRSGRVSFGCFEDLVQITAEMLGLWAKLLQACRDARLLLCSRAFRSEAARRSVQERFDALGVAPKRLALSVPEAARERALARWAEVDIALDTFPCSAMLGTCDALWMGVPVITLAGRTLPSRAGADILRDAGLPELVARDGEEYLRLALALADDPARLAGYRAGLRAKLQFGPLLDAAGFARAMESAYHRMWRAHADGAESVLTTESDNE
jgi:predicted O-linked N-acetylglucosamine transferase (SPINDLY family)